jgi:LysR family glycine cleavage system transcriptional activator
MGEMDSSVVTQRRLPPLGALRAFEAAARRLSFRRAAEELCVTPTAVSHQIRLLEEWLGQPLFLRLVRRVVLTKAGETLLPTLQGGFDAFERTLADIRQHDRRKAVTLTAPVLFTARRLIPALADFQAGDLDLRLHASDAVVDLNGGGADLAVRYGAGPFSGLVSEPLVSERFGVVSSPRLRLTRVDDLFSVPLLHIDWRRAGDDPDWKRWATEAGLSGLAVEKGARFSDDTHALAAATAGRGAAIAALELARPELEAGLLVNPFGPILQGQPYHLAATPEAWEDERVQAVASWLRQAIIGAAAD